MIMSTKVLQLYIDTNKYKHISKVSENQSRIYGWLGYTTA